MRARTGAPAWVRTAVRVALLVAALIAVVVPATAHAFTFQRAGDRVLVSRETSDAPGLAIQTRIYYGYKGGLDPNASFSPVASASYNNYTPAYYTFDSGGAVKAAEIKLLPRLDPQLLYVFWSGGNACYLALDYYDTMAEGQINVGDVQSVSGIVQVEPYGGAMPVIGANGEPLNVALAGGSIEATIPAKIEANMASIGGIDSAFSLTGFALMIAYVGFKFVRGLRRA